jgi:hypothetical protein
MYIRIWQHVFIILEYAKLEVLKSSYTENSNTASKEMGGRLVYDEYTSKKEMLRHSPEMIYGVGFGLPKTTAYMDVEFSTDNALECFLVSLSRLLDSFTSLQFGRNTSFRTPSLIPDVSRYS